MARRSIDVLCWLLLLCLATGCTVSPREKAVQQGLSHGFQQVLFHTTDFDLFALYRPPAAHADDQSPSVSGPRLRVYIEGDGRAWITRSRPSSDPTPHTPVALRLAIADPAHDGRDALLYLARPCQYVRGDNSRNCVPKYWTNARLAPEVIESLDTAISMAKQWTEAREVILTGFSGGGGAAALVAARRQDVVFLASVAGNLDSATWTRLLGVSPLDASLDPITVAPAVAHIPQRHWSGAQDTIVPAAVGAGFCRATGQPKAHALVPGMEHDGPWETVWDYRY